MAPYPAQTITGFAVYTNDEDEHDNTLQRTMPALHNNKCRNILDKLKGGNSWSASNHTNLWQTRPYQVHRHYADTATQQANKIIYAIPIADNPTNGTTNSKKQPSGLTNEHRSRPQARTTTVKHGTTKHVEGSQEAYRIRCPFGCGQNKWRDSNSQVPQGPTFTHQARIRCKECGKDFPVNKGTCVTCGLQAIRCMCALDLTGSRGWTKNLNPIQRLLHRTSVGQQQPHDQQDCTTSHVNTHWLKLPADTQADKRES